MAADADHIATQRALEGNIFWESCPAHREVDLKVGARVMLLANVNTKNKLVNGELGRLKEFREIDFALDEISDLQQCKTNTETAELAQWLRTNHVSSESSRTPADGGFCRILRFPVVQFDRAGEHTIFPHTFKCDVPFAGWCWRTQIPLRLAWAMTHHKAQGQGFPATTVNPESFSDGQTYVALSRAQSIGGLRLERPLEMRRIRANVGALHFLRTKKRLRSRRAISPEWRG